MSLPGVGYHLLHTQHNVHFPKCYRLVWVELLCEDGVSLCCLLAHTYKSKGEERPIPVIKLSSKQHPT